MARKRKQNPEYGKLLTKLMNDGVKMDRIRQHWDADQDARRPYDYQWLDNINMVAGNQWACWNPTTGSWFEEPGPTTDFPKVQFDLVTGDRDILLSRMLANWPIPHAKPHGIYDPSGNSVNRAERWTTFFEYKYADLRDDDFLREKGQHLIELGTIFTHPDFDPDAGTDLIEIDEQGDVTRKVPRGYCQSCGTAFKMEDAQMPGGPMGGMMGGQPGGMMGGMGGQMPGQMPGGPLTCPYCHRSGTEEVFQIPDSTETFYGPTGEQLWIPQGDVTLELWPSWEVYPQAGAPSLKKARHLWRKRYLPTSTIQRYAYTDEQIVDEEPIDKMDNWDFMIQDITRNTNSIYGHNSNSHERQQHGSAAFVEYWEKPGTDKNYPGGLYVRFCKKELTPIYVRPYPYPINSVLNKTFGLKMDRWDVVSGRFWGVSHIEKMESYQRKLNASVSHIVYDQKLYGRRKIIVDKRHGISTEKFMGSGLVVEARLDKETAVPYLLSTENTNPQLFQMLEYDVQMYERMSNINNILRGQSAPNQRTATGTDMLREQAEAPILMKIQPIYSSEIPIAREVMRLVRNNYLPERDIAASYVAGHLTGGFKAKELGVKGAEEEFQGEVKLVIDLNAVWSLTFSDELNRVNAFVTTFMQTGIIDLSNPQVADYFMNKYGIDAEVLQPTMQIHKDKQEREIRRIIAGKPVQVSGTDDDQIHMNVIGNFLNSQEGDKMLEESPDIYRQLEAHHQEHWARFNEAMFQQQAMQQRAMADQGLAGGAPPTRPPGV
jgi:hypothetical protein